jgi:uncharacterized membrane protein YuzA (DUF378 family)
MLLTEILDLLAGSELANLNCVVDGAVLEAKIPAIVTAINIGLVKLYTRFQLKKRLLTLKVTSTQLVYSLVSANAVSVNVGGYIQDVDDPFTNDIIQLLTMTSTAGNNIRFDGFNGVMLLSPKTFRFAEAPEDDTYVIEYVARPAKVVYVDDTDIEVDLPDAYLPPLLAYIASRFYSPVGIALDSNRSSLDVSYLQRYETECQLLENKGINTGNYLESDNFTQHGFI